MILPHFCLLVNAFDEISAFVDALQRLPFFVNNLLFLRKTLAKTAFMNYN